MKNKEAHSTIRHMHVHTAQSGMQHKSNTNNYQVAERHKSEFQLATMLYCMYILHFNKQINKTFFDVTFDLPTSCKSNSDSKNSLKLFPRFCMIWLYRGWQRTIFYLFFHWKIFSHAIEPSRFTTIKFKISVAW